MNVFVCDGQTLKLGDFGIVRHLRDRRGIRAHTLNRLTAPLEILDGAAPMWQARDDVYQVGQLLGMLMGGGASSSGMDIGSLVAQVAGGGVGGGILLVLVGLVRQMLGGGGQAARS